MTAKRNFSRELDQIAESARQQGYAPTLLLQACCAPCSSACLERLREDFRVTVYYYNPNITDSAEYVKRKEEEKRLIAELNRQVKEQDFAFSHPLSAEEDGRSTLAADHPELLRAMHSTSRARRIDILEAPYDPERFLVMARGMEEMPEGGARCFACYALRLKQTAEAALAGGFDYFSTTLTISPLKNADRLNEIGEKMAAQLRGERAPRFLPSDFKKKNGYLRSIQLSHEFGLYRQNYCGCEFSRRQAEQKKSDRM